jgi:small subunit ribosomal protein S11e
MVQGYRSWLQDSFRSHQWHLHWSAGLKTFEQSRGANGFGSVADKKCPFTGEVSIRGRILTGKVISTKMNRTIIIRRDYLHYIPKYRAWKPFLLYRGILITIYLLDRYEKRHKNLAAHVSPAFRVELGDVVTVGMFIFPGLRVH